MQHGGSGLWKRAPSTQFIQSKHCRPQPINNFLYLTPAARSCTQISCTCHSFTNVKFFINVKQREGTSGPPALLFGLPVVDITLVLGTFPHHHLKMAAADDVDGVLTCTLDNLSWFALHLEIPEESLSVGILEMDCSNSPRAWRTGWEPVRKSHCHVFLGGLDPRQAPLKTLLLMPRLT